MLKYVHITIFRIACSEFGINSCWPNITMVWTIQLLFTLESHQVIQSFRQHLSFFRKYQDSAKLSANSFLMIKLIILLLKKSIFGLNFFILFFRLNRGDFLFTIMHTYSCHYFCKIQRYQRLPFKYINILLVVKINIFFPSPMQ